MLLKHLFGPVISRRLGISLGVDLVPYKFCPLNCVYCEVQQTTHQIRTREEFFALADVTRELDSYLRSSPHLDFITFSGAGEPTLYNRLGELINYVKTRYPAYLLCLITNSVLLPDADLRKEILAVDVILPSLDAVSQDVFETINRPLSGLKADDIVTGLIALRQEFRQEIWLEVFIVPGANDHDEELDRIAHAIRKIRPDKVQINSLDRPGSEDWVEVAPLETLHHARQIIAQCSDTPVEIIAKVKYDRTMEPLDEETIDAIRSVLIHRSYSAEDMAQTLSLHINEVGKVLRQLAMENRVSALRKDGKVIYKWLETLR